MWWAVWLKLLSGIGRFGGVAGLFAKAPQQVWELPCGAVGLLAKALWRVWEVWGKLWAFWLKLPSGCGRFGGLADARDGGKPVG